MSRTLSSSWPTTHRGQQATVRADSTLVRIYVAGVLVKTHAVVAPGRRQTDYQDYPAEKTRYAMRDAAGTIRRAYEEGTGTGQLCERLLSGTFPWSKLRQAQKLLRMVDTFGATKVDEACRRALMYDVVNVFKVESIVLQALAAQGSAQPAGSAPLSGPPLRFLRDGSTLRESPRDQRGQ